MNCSIIIRVKGTIMNEALKLENYSYEDYLEIDKSTKERVELIFGKIYMRQVE